MPVNAGHYGSLRGQSKISLVGALELFGAEDHPVAILFVKDEFEAERLFLVYEILVNHSAPHQRATVSVHLIALTLNRFQRPVLFLESLIKADKLVVRQCGAKCDAGVAIGSIVFVRYETVRVVCNVH